MPTHFADLVRLLEFLDKNKFPTLIYGGWGLDVLFGKQTRLHDDVDNFLYQSDRIRFIETIKAAGYTVFQDAPYKTVWSGSVIGKGYVETHYMKESEDGNTMLLGFPKDWMRVPLKYVRAEPMPIFEGVSVPCVCSELIVLMNRRWGYDTEVVESLAKTCRKEVMDMITLKEFF